MIEIPSFLRQEIDAKCRIVEVTFRRASLGKVVSVMHITDVRVRRVESDGRMKAIASITFDGMFVVRDIRVIEGHNGLFVAMPSRKTPTGEFRDIAHPINSECRELIQSAILQHYESAE